MKEGLKREKMEKTRKRKKENKKKYRRKSAVQYNYATNTVQLTQ